MAQQVELAPPMPALRMPVTQESSLGPVDSASENDNANNFAELVQRLEELESQVERELAEAKQPTEQEQPKKKSWFEKYTISGYTQLRINETVDDRGPAAPHHNGDSSISDNQSFLLRRARMVLSGDVNDHVSIYLQPDFASSVPGSPDSNHFVQVRDWYADIYLDTDRVHRLRAGQSKVPYGWENCR